MDQSIDKIDKSIDKNDQSNDKNDQSINKIYQSLKKSINWSINMIGLSLIAMLDKLHAYPT